MGQIVSWPHNDLLQDDPDTPHAKLRKKARDIYFSTTRRQEKKHGNQLRKLAKTFNVGDTVGIKMHSIDRTNTDARILPCKVLDIKPNSQVPYQLYTTTRILQARFSAKDMQDLGKVPFQALDATDPATLTEISVIRASREYSSWNSKPSENTVCSFKGSCITKRCTCRKNGLKCSTKCHTSSSCCQNHF